MDAFHEYYLDVFKHHYVDFDGRVRRRTYWMFTLFNVGIAVAIAFVLGVVSDGLADFVGGLYALAVLPPGLGLAVRRLHDTGRSGWWALVALVPILGFFVLLYFMVLEGDPGPNEYGPDPKDPVAAGAGLDEFSGVLDR